MHIIWKKKTKMVLLYKIVSPSNLFSTESRPFDDLSAIGIPKDPDDIPEDDGCSPSILSLVGGGDGSPSSSISRLDVTVNHKLFTNLKVLLTKNTYPIWYTYNNHLAIVEQQKNLLK